MKQANFLIKKLAAICLFFHLLFLTLFITGSTGKVPGTELWYSTLRMRKMKMTTTKTKPTPTTSITNNHHFSIFNQQNSK